MDVASSTSYEVTPIHRDWTLVILSLQIFLQGDVFFVRVHIYQNLDSKMGAGGLNGELRDNSNNYIDTVLQYHLNGLRETRTSGPYQHQFTFRTSNANPTFPSSSSSSSNTTSNTSSPTLTDEVMVCYSCSVSFNLWKRKVNRGDFLLKSCMIDRYRNLRCHIK